MLGLAEEAAGMSKDVEREPACPFCGLTGPVSPSRKQPGRWWCDGCAEHFEGVERDRRTWNYEANRPNIGTPETSVEDDEGGFETSGKPRS